MVIKAQSPAGFAEEYIIESIWNNRFPPGSILPAERELSELIGVTRTTLREVLQRLARDGWLTIRHGKPTQVNNFWDTSGLNILETLGRLEPEKFPDLVQQLLSARTNISAIFIRSSIRNNRDKVIEVLKEKPDFSDPAEDFARYDYQFYHALAFASGNLIYVLILNGFQRLYQKVGGFYFEYPEAKKLALDFYAQIETLNPECEHEQVWSLVREYGQQSGRIWDEIKADMPESLIGQG